MLSSFIIVVVLIYSIYYLVNRYGKGFIPGQKGFINILDIKYLGKNKGLALVKVNEKYFFLSFDEKKVSIIEKWETLSNKGENIKENEDKSENSN